MGRKNRRKEENINKAELLASVCQASENADMSSFALYLKDVPSEAVLTRKEEKELFFLYLNGTPLEKETSFRILCERNLKLVISIAKNYQNRGLDMEDLVQDGNVGLIKAIERFDPDKGYKFSTYATWWITQAIQRSISNTGKTIRTPVYLETRINAMRNATNKLAAELKKEPDIQEIADEMGVSIQDVVLLRNASRDCTSINTLVSDNCDNSDSLSLCDVIEDDSEPSVEEKTEINILKETINEILQCLNDRSAYVLIHRYGLENGNPETLDEVSKALGITRERVRQIERQAFVAMRKRLAQDNLIDYARSM